MIFPIARLPKGIPHRGCFFHFGRAIEPKQRFWLLLTDGLTSLEIFREEKDLAVGMCGFRSGIYGESLPLAAFTWQKRFAYNPLSSWSTSNEYLLGHRWASKINNILESGGNNPGNASTLCCKAAPKQFSTCVCTGTCLVSCFKKTWRFIKDKCQHTVRT